MKAKQLYFLEGLPSAGKTSVKHKLLENGFLAIPEICKPEELHSHHNKTNQDFFLINDEVKVNLAENSTGTVIIDRSPLSTLFFNLAKLEPNSDAFQKVLDWYKITFQEKFSTNEQYGFIIMDVSPVTSLKRKNEPVNPNDPWRSPDSLKLIRQMYLHYCLKWLKNVHVVNAEGTFDEVYMEVKKIVD